MRTFLDLDLREVNWRSHDEYANTVAQIVGDVDVVVGTEDEYATLLRLTDRGQSMIGAVSVRSAALLIRCL